MKNLLFTILFLLTFIRLDAQENPGEEIKQVKYDQTENLEKPDFDRERIESYKSQKEFEYLNAETEESWWSRFKKWLNHKYQQFISWLFGEYSPGSFLSWFIGILPFLLILLLLGLIAWLFSRLSPGGKIFQKPDNPQVFLSEEEELVRKEDLPVLIQKAVKNGQFRLAVRYYYLNELRELEEAEHIRYEFQKTNLDYREEIEDDTIRKLFSEITKIYEFIWYGGFDVSESDYRLAEKGFLKLERILKNAGHE